MKKILTLTFSSFFLLYAVSPIHDIMDNRIKGKSYSGALDDNAAAEDGLGIIPLNGYSIAQPVANELIIQKVLSKIEKNETNSINTVNIKLGLANGVVGDTEDIAIYNKIYPPVIYDKVPASGNGITSKGIVYCKDATPGQTVKIEGNDYYVGINVTDVQNHLLGFNSNLNSSPGGTIPSNRICTSHLTDFTSMFQNSTMTSVDIANWDTSSVQTFDRAFFNTHFQPDLSNWDVSSGTNFGWMFASSSFNMDISQWDVSNALNVGGMFYTNKTFYQNLSKWDLTNILNQQSPTNWDGFVYQSRIFNTSYMPKMPTP